MRPLLLAKRTK